MFSSKLRQLLTSTQKNLNLLRVGRSSSVLQLQSQTTTNPFFQPPPPPAQNVFHSRFFSAAVGARTTRRSPTNTRSPRRKITPKKKRATSSMPHRLDADTNPANDLLLKSRLGFYTSPLRGNSVVLKGQSWLERKEMEEDGFGTARRMYKTLGRRRKALNTRRPDSILVNGYLPNVERQLKRHNVGQQRNTNKSGGPVFKKELAFADIKRGYLYANYTKSNFIFTLTDIDGNCISRISSGSMNLDKFSRKAPFAAEDAARQVSQTASSKGLQMVDIIFRGKGFQNYRIGSIMKGLQHNNILARRVKKDLNTPHGGCRQKKQRRI